MANWQEWRLQQSIIQTSTLSRKSSDEHRAATGLAESLRQILKKSEKRANRVNRAEVNKRNKFDFRFQFSKCCFEFYCWYHQNVHSQINRYIKIHWMCFTWRLLYIWTDCMSCSNSTFVSSLVRRQFVFIALIDGLNCLICCFFIIPVLFWSDSLFVLLDIRFSFSVFEAWIEQQKEFFLKKSQLRAKKFRFISKRKKNIYMCLGPVYRKTMIFEAIERKTKLPTTRHNIPQWIFFVFILFLSSLSIEHKNVFQLIFIYESNRNVFFYFQNRAHRKWWPMIKKMEIW